MCFPVTLTLTLLQLFLLSLSFLLTLKFKVREPMTTADLTLASIT